MCAPDREADSADPHPLVLVPDAVVRAEFGISAMTLHRWGRDRSLKFPPALVVRGRKFRLRASLEAFKTRLIEAAASGEAKPHTPAYTPRRPAKKAQLAGGAVG